MSLSLCSYCHTRRKWADLCEVSGSAQVEVKAIHLDHMEVAERQEWYGTASLILYNRVTITDIIQLLHGIAGKSITGLKDKKDLCALIKHLRIVKASAPTSTGATDVPAVPADVERLTELRDIRALNVALGPEWHAPADVDATRLEVESVRANDPLPLASEQLNTTTTGPTDRPLPALHSLELQYYKANRPMFVPDRFSGLNAIQLLSPDHICLHYDGDESARDVPIADPRRGMYFFICESTALH